MNDLQEFKNKMLEINEENNKQVTELIGDAIKKEVDLIFKESYNQHIKEIIEDKIKKFETTFNNQIQNTHDRINQAGEYVVEFKRDTEDKFDEHSKEIKVVRSKTDTLEFNGRSEELKKYIHSKIYKSTGIRYDSLEETLFFGELNRWLQKEIKDKYGIRRYGLLLENDLPDCKEFIDNWFPHSNYKAKIMIKYRDKKDRVGLPCSLKEPYEKYLHIHGGIVK